MEPSITETVPSFSLTTYILFGSVRVFTSTRDGARPTAMFSTKVSVLASTTETELLAEFAI
jgi:hypothetical protein